MLWAFQINKKKDINGNEIELPYYNYTHGLASRPLPFQFDCKARTAAKAAIIRESWSEAKASDPLRD